MTFSVHEGDYITENATSLTPQLFDTHMQPGYDVIISNPPYFKLQKQDRRAIAAAAIVHGQPNIYALFMSVSAALLNDNGVMVTITPRSFTTGEYFRRFRQHLFGIVVPQAVHLFHSRREAFHKDDVLQENVIVRFCRSAPSTHATVCVGMSTGVDDLEHRSERRIPLQEVVDLRSRNVYFNIPTDETDDKIAMFVRGWPDTLHRLGLEVSTGPIVAFRCRRFLVCQPCHHQPTVPMLWLHNVRHMSVTWPTGVGGKAQYIHESEDIAPYLVRNATYVVLRRFTAKEEHRRLTAAPLLGGSLPGALLGLENHLNYVHRPGGTMHDAEAIGLAALFSSALLDRYFRISNGHTQVNAAELRALPLPTHNLLVNLGEEIQGHSVEPDQIDVVVAEVLRVPRSLLGMIDAEGHGQG